MTQNTSAAVMQQRHEPHDSPSTPTEAKAMGLRWYFTGQPCAKGHMAKRSVSNRECRACVDARRADKDLRDPNRARERNFKRYHKDIKASRKKVREARKLHGDARREYDRERYQDPKRKAWQKRQAKAWGKANRGKRNRIIAARRWWVKRATPAWLNADHMESIKAIYAEAASYGVGIMHVDHIVPIRGESVCGLHVPWNLQILPSAENVAKGNRYEA